MVGDVQGRRAQSMPSLRSGADATAAQIWADKRVAFFRVGFFRDQNKLGAGFVTIDFLLARPREGGSRSDECKWAKTAEIWQKTSVLRLTKREIGSRMKVETVRYRSVARWKSYVSKGENGVERA